MTLECIGLKINPKDIVKFTNAKIVNIIKRLGK